ncbi:hypothetical protein FQA39_LY13094 [Lamprigera yunnana]|nr:hypothetical protein FQA39_LY13094 [Lamprigera yunnana]
MASDLEKQIIKQIEYYFGDYNLPRDKFLKEQIAKDEGWVKLTTLLTFERLAKISNDEKVIVEALKKSEDGIVVVSEDDTKIRRNPEKPAPEQTEDYKKEVMGRTAYAKGFPMDEPLDDIIKFIEADHGSLESCVKRSYLDKALKERKFKGSCFIIFKTLDDCKKFVEAESLKYKDTELIRKFQGAYLEGKKQEFLDRKNKKKKFKEVVPKVEIKLPKGIIFHFSGVPTGHILTREEIKDKIVEINEAPPSYIGYNKGDTEGYVRMTNENEAVEFYKKLSDGILEVGDLKLPVRVLEGEEEVEHVKQITEIMQKKRQSVKKGRRNLKRQANDEETGRSKKTKV